MIAQLFNILILMHYLIIDKVDSSDYWSKRKAMLQSDLNLIFGSKIKLNDQEEKVNSLLMRYKLEEYNEGFKNLKFFYASQHFLKVKKYIEKSNVFNLIKPMPKGCLLHVHDMSFSSPELVFNLTFVDNLYICIQKDNNIRFLFSDSPPLSDICKYQLLSNIRKNNQTWIDNLIKEKISFTNEIFDNVNDAWNKFTDIFLTIFPLITYEPNTNIYFQEALKTLYEDNIIYVEFRGVLDPTYKLNGKKYSLIETLAQYKKNFDQFRRKHPNFLGGRFIFAPQRFVNNDTSLKYLQRVRQLKKQFPEFLAGFDLVGQEDLGLPLKNFYPILEPLAKEDIKFFFHAGETEWYGTQTDENLLDAVLLNTFRIGHGFALPKHPLLLETVKLREIAVEVSPISNQILKLVDDLRNHPMAPLFSQDSPLVITNDDPGLWGAKGLSYDFYEAFMGLMSQHADLRALKLLGLNSIKYSSMHFEEKANAIKIFESQWEKYISDTINTFNL